MNKRLGKEDIEKIIDEKKKKKIGKPADIAKCVNRLIEDEFTTGQIISVNGGWLII